MLTIVWSRKKLIRSGQHQSDATHFIHNDSGRLPLKRPHRLQKAPLPRCKGRRIILYFSLAGSVNAEQVFKYEWSQVTVVLPWTSVSRSAAVRHHTPSELIIMSHKNVLLTPLTSCHDKSYLSLVLLLANQVECYLFSCHHIHMYVFCSDPPLMWRLHWLCDAIRLYSEFHQGVWKWKQQLTEETGSRYCESTPLGISSFCSHHKWTDI